MESVNLLVSKETTEHLLFSDKWAPVEPVSSVRKIKKCLRDAKPALVVLKIDNGEDKELAKQAADLLRIGLCNEDARLVLLRHPSVSLDEAHWMEQYQINSCLVDQEESITYNQSVLKRELQTFQHIEAVHCQHNAETEMLMSISRFSRQDESLSDLINVFSESLSNLCHAPYQFHIYVTKTDEWNLNSYRCDSKKSVDHLINILNPDSRPACLTQAMNERRAQINLLHEESGLETIVDSLDKKIGSYLTFPVVVYEKTVCLLLYLIPEDKIDKVSMRQINVVNKACEQLSVLLERQKAESSLKKQYSRLQKTLIELKTTKEELAQKEKMAAIGTMAAGIAHEINNPLAYVISSVSSMDKYVGSILHLQTMQSELLASIDYQQDQQAIQLQESISEYENNEDIPFVLEDIRAVVSDSFEGLQRVKTIISDLQSFTTESEATCEAYELDEFIKMLAKEFQYQVDEKIAFSSACQGSCLFRGNRALVAQVVKGLINNSNYALLDSQDENPQITLRGVESENSVEISVEDNGPGIPVEIRDKVFDPFFTTKTVGDGKGLGLSVAHNIVTKLGGTLTFTSQVGEYTRFMVSLPKRTHPEGQ